MSEGVGGWVTLSVSQPTGQGDRETDGRGSGRGRAGKAYRISPSMHAALSVQRSPKYILSDFRKTQVAPDGAQIFKIILQKN